MKQLLPLLLLLLGFSSVLQAQDAIYTANGNRISDVRLTNLTDDRVYFIINKDEKSLSRQNILFAFSNTGNFLLISSLSADLDQAKEQLRTFLSAPLHPGNKDYLIRAVPFKVLPATIQYENDAIVNYVTEDGKPASISKGELVAIIYRTGKHNLIREPADVAALLPDISAYFKSASATVPPPATTVQQPTNKAPKAIEATPVAQPTTPVTSPSTQDTVQQAEKVTSGKSLSLSEAQYQYYRKKSIQTVEEFAQYLNIITNKSISLEARNQAITQASKLFMPAATMEVASSNRAGSRRYPIKEYLNRLKLLPYTSTKIEWTEVQFLKELSQAADGNYYGTITGQQTFIGSGSNAYYSDVTSKNVRVKLERLPVVIDGIENTSWNLLLGSIGISAQ
ncbi:hypothetical protein [Fibrivirga algicola]|uniref:Uncharacterized protein n=1 Tax=Fibrivirga algicola TaxID=2950420 RepID=A0ABX0QCW2_9BACT|nr:hypothetical protein [Fibrivirga algicola]NID10205.1 hypothetical protein [Fibrivirga algicola]